MREERLRRKDYSTVEKKEYIFEHIVYGILFGFDVYQFLPVIAPIAYYHQSVIKLILCMLITCFIGIVLTYKYHRTDFGSFVDINCGLGLYVILTIGAYKSWVVKALIVICVVLSLAFVVLLFSRKIKRRDRIRQIIRNRIHRSLLVVRRNVGCICTVALVLVPALVHFTPEDKIVSTYYDIAGVEEPVAQKPEEEKSITQDCDEYKVTQAYDDRYMLEKNIDVIKKIRTNEEFQKLSYEEKCEVITATIYCEARYLGLCKFNLEFKELSGNTKGCYIHSSKTIIIDSKQLKDEANLANNVEILSTICHETRHCYQHLLSEAYMKATPEERNLYAYTNEGVKDWVTNIQDYKSVDETSSEVDHLKYMSQPIEIDARKFAASEVDDFFYWIDKYAKWSGSSSE